MLCPDMNKYPRFKSFQNWSFKEQNVSIFHMMTNFLYQFDWFYGSTRVFTS